MPSCTRPVWVKDRQGLEAASCECYPTIRAHCAFESDRQRALALTQAIAAAQNEQFRLEYDIDRRGGGDYGQRAVPSAEACKTVCNSDGNCQSFTFVKAPSGVANGQCFLKRMVPAPIVDRCCVSAKRKSAQQEIIGNIR